MLKWIKQGFFKKQPKQSIEAVEEKETPPDNPPTSDLSQLSEVVKLQQLIQTLSDNPSQKTAAPFFLQLIRGLLLKNKALLLMFKRNLLLKIKKLSIKLKLRKTLKTMIPLCRIMVTPRLISLMRRQMLWKEIARRNF
jgi:hypothetical protein